MLTASQITHLANSMRYMQQSSIKNRASSIKNPSVLRFASCVWSLRFLSNILYKSPHFYAKQTQFPKLPKSSQAQSPQRITKMKTLQQAPKTNPNEPKRTQSKPNFSPVRAAQTQSKPKQTQNKANRARSLRMTCSKSSNRMTNRRWSCNNAKKGRLRGNGSFDRFAGTAPNEQKVLCCDVSHPTTGRAHGENYSERALC